MENIDSTTVIVYTPSDLASALSMDNGIGYVFLGDNITIGSVSGILVHPNKSSLVIDGLYEPISSEIRTISDYGTDDGTIRINTPSRIDITFQNLTIAGRNYHGMPRVYDTAAAEYVTVTYRKVTYTGPQITWHVNGLTRYIDCDITIMRTGGSIMHEVAEVRWVEFGGNTIIRHNNGTGWPAFLVRKAGSSFTVLEGANVEISTDYDFLQRENDYPKFVIEPYASLVLTTQQGISRDAGHYVSSFLVDEYASFRYIRKSNSGSDAALFVGGAFTVNKGASVYMQADFEGSSKRLIHFNANQARGLYINNPKCFILYNRGPGAALGFSSSSTPFSFKGSQVNYWLEAMLFPTAGTFDDPPLYQWHLPDWSDFEIRGIATSALTTIEYYTPGLLAESELSKMLLHSARVLSVGALPLSVNPVIIEEKRVTGSTDPSARVQVKYVSRSTDCRVECGVEEDSSFLAPLEEEEEVIFGTAVTVASNTPFLITTVVEVARYVDDLHIVAPETIAFGPNPILFSPAILPRSSEDPENPERVIVTDTREIKTAWRIWAQITGPLKTDEGDVLADAVVYAPDEGEMITLSAQQEQEVYFSDELNEETIIEWDEDKGVLARITDPVRSGKSYSTLIIWEVRPIEETTEGGDAPWFLSTIIRSE